MKSVSVIPADAAKNAMFRISLVTSLDGPLSWLEARNYVAPLPVSMAMLIIAPTLLYLCDYVSLKKR